MDITTMTATAHRWLVSLAGITTIAAGAWGIVDKSALGVPMNVVAYVTVVIGTVLLMVNYLRSATDPQPAPPAPPAPPTV
jgi:hypothetical protein